MTAARTIYEIAEETPSSGAASVLRCVIARIAVEDPRWRATYDRMLESQTGPVLEHPETVTLATDTESVYVPVFLTDPSISPREAAATMVEQAAMLGTPDQHATTAELAAAVLGAEVWMAAVNADNLAYAAAKGPDAIASAAALLARATGNGVDVMPLDPDWPALRFPQQNVLRAIEHARRWVSNNRLDHLWDAVGAMAVTDLAYRATGKSKTHEASLLLGVRMEQLR